MFLTLFADDDEVLIDTTISTIEATAPAADSAPAVAEMHIDAEGRPRFAPAKQNVRYPTNVHATEA